MRHMSNRIQQCEDFGRRIRKFRLLRELSQESLAEKTQIHRTYIGGIERGERNPTLLMIHRLAAALDISPATLLSDEE